MLSTSAKNGVVQMPLNTTIGIKYKSKIGGDIKRAQIVAGPVKNNYLALFKEDDVDFEICFENDEDRHFEFNLNVINVDYDFVIKPRADSSLSALVSNGKHLHFASEKSNIGSSIISLAAEEHQLSHNETAEMMSLLKFDVHYSLEHSKIITVFVKSVDFYSPLRISISNRDTVFGLKQKINTGKIFSIRPEDGLCYENHLLKDDYVLYEHEITDGSTLHVLKHYKIKVQCLDCDLPESSISVLKLESVNDIENKLKTSGILFDPYKDEIYYGDVLLKHQNIVDLGIKDGAALNIVKPYTITVKCPEFGLPDLCLSSLKSKKISDLKKKIKKAGIYLIPHQDALYYGNVPLKDEDTLDACGIKDGAILHIKDDEDCLYNAKPNKIKVYVEHVNSFQFRIFTLPTRRISNLKEQIRSAEIPLTGGFFYGYIRLDDNETLEKYSIKDGAKLKIEYGTSKDKSVTLFVKTLDDETMRMDCNLKDTGDSLLSRISELNGIPFMQQRLRFQGQSLSDTLSSNEVCDGDIIELYRQRTGGGGIIAKPLPTFERGIVCFGERTRQKFGKAEPLEIDYHIDIMPFVIEMRFLSNSSHHQ